MKKVLAMIIAVALIATIAVTAVSAKGKQHFDFGWNHGFGCEESQRPEKPETNTDCPEKDEQHPARPETDTDFPEHNEQRPARPETDTDCSKPEHGKPGDQHKPEDDGNCPPQKPMFPQLPQRPNTGMDGAETKTDIDTNTDVENPLFNNIFDVVVELHKRGHHGKEFRIPKYNDLFALLDMIIDGDEVFFGFCRLDEEQPEFEEIAMDDLENAPEGMDVIEMGDNNADGKVAADDALEILKHVVGAKRMEHQGRQLLSDLTEDEVIGADDALCVLKKVVGKEY